MLNHTASGHQPARIALLTRATLLPTPPDHPPMPFYVYILKCADGSYYTGHTEDLDVRIAAHHQGIIPGYTRKRRPVQFVFADEFPTRAS